MTDPVFGVAVQIKVLGADQIRVSIIDIDEDLRSSVCDVVEPEIERHRSSSWNWPPLHNMCSELSDEIVRKIREMRVVGLTATRMEGTWTGNVIAEHTSRTKDMRKDMNDDADGVLGYGTSRMQDMTKDMNDDAYDVPGYGAASYTAFDVAFDAPSTETASVHNHSWVRVRRGTIVLELDPTYVQFTGETWSYAGCIEAVQHCKNSVEAEIDRKYFPNVN